MQMQYQAYLRTKHVKHMRMVYVLDKCWVNIAADCVAQGAAVPVRLSRLGSTQQMLSESTVKLSHMVAATN